MCAETELGGHTCKSYVSATQYSEPVQEKEKQIYRECTAQIRKELINV